LIKNETVEDSPRSGRPTILSEEKLKEIVEMVTSNLQLSIRQGGARAGISKARYQLVVFNCRIQTLQSNRKWSNQKGWEMDRILSSC